MKKILLGVATAVAAMCTTAANADLIPSDEIRPYVGVDYKYFSGFQDEKFIGEGLEDYGNLLGATVGLQFNDFIGLELSWAGTIKDLGRNVEGLFVEVGDIRLDASNINADFEHWTVGVTGQYPLADKVYAKALVGASWQKLKTDYTLTLAAEEPMGEVQAIAAIDSIPVKRTVKNNGEFLAKIGLGYQVNEKSVFEGVYTRDGKLDGLAVQYKYFF